MSLLEYMAIGRKAVGSTSNRHCLRGRQKACHGCSKAYSFEPALQWGLPEEVRRS